MNSASAAEMRKGGGDIGLCAAKGDFQMLRLAEALEAGRGEPEHQFAKGEDARHNA